MSEAKTICNSCGTHWCDVDVLADGQCATCLLNERDSESRWAADYLRERDEARAELDECRRLLREACDHMDDTADGWAENWMERAAKAGVDDE